jgi:hypothetical protein
MDSYFFFFLPLLLILVVWKGGSRSFFKLCLSMVFLKSSGTALAAGRRRRCTGEKPALVHPQLQVPTKFIDKFRSSTGNNGRREQRQKPLKSKWRVAG